jgi:hypothetical protein
MSGMIYLVQAWTTLFRSSVEKPRNYRPKAEATSSLSMILPEPQNTFDRSCHIGERQLHHRKDKDHDGTVIIPRGMSRPPGVCKS